MQADEHTTNENLMSKEELDRKLFMQDLNKFMSENGKPLSKIPIMGYKELDLFQLYREVMNFGGFNEVVKNVGTWSKIWKRLANFDPSITDSSFRLKRNYERYLLQYEYKCRPDHRQQAIDNERQQHRRTLPKDQSSPPLPRLHNHTSFPQQHAASAAPFPLSSSSPSPSSPLSSSSSASSPPSSSLAQPSSCSPPLPRKARSSSPASSPSPSSSPKSSRPDKMDIEMLTSLSSSSSASSPTLSPSEERHKKRCARKAAANAAAAEAALKVPRDAQGFPQLPLDLGDLILESLGFVVPRAPYLTEKHIWPIGFRISRRFNSMLQPDRLVKYTCTILDGGDRPQFLIEAEDQPGKLIQAQSPSSAWRTVLRTIEALTLVGGPRIKHIDGSGRFGLSHPIVAQLLKELPDADKALHHPPSPTFSPSPSQRKRKGSVDMSSSEDSQTAEEPACKFPRIETVQMMQSCEEIVFNTREELDDLENAVATLNALKFCSVY